MRPRVAPRLTFTLLPRLFIRQTHALPPYVHSFPDPSDSARKLLTLLPSSPPNSSLAIGTTSSLPPTPSSFRANPSFLPIVQTVISKHAIHDPHVIASAASYASEAGLTFQGRQGRGATGAGPSASQGGIGSAGRGGFVHVSDLRKPPDWGRIADPEDIFGSVEVDGHGKFVGEAGNYQESGTYRLVTNDGILGLSPYLLEKLLEKLKELEKH